MKLSFCLMVFAVSIVLVLKQSQAAAVAFSSEIEENYNDRPLKRIARQFPPPPPPPPPPEMPEMTMPQMDNLSRKKREAKGGGYMPTKKG